MPTPPLRFIHAANLFLNCQFDDAGLVPDGWHETAQQATLVALDRIVAAAIDHDADFLLLTGNTFVESDQSLRAETALLDGFSRLTEHNIRVVVLPGTSDPPDAWQGIPQIPGSVGVLSEGASPPLAIFRDAATIAQIGEIEFFSDACSDGRIRNAVRHIPATPAEQWRPFRIGLLKPGSNAATSQIVHAAIDDNGDGELLRDAIGRRPCDYLALGGEAERRTVTLAGGIAHSPGAPQGLSRHQTGPHGCTLVEVDSERTVQCRFIPTASVRWESLPLLINSAVDAEMLTRQMIAALGDLHAEPGEDLWIVRWQLDGRCALVDELFAPQFQQQLVALLRNAVAIEERPALHHCFEVRPQTDHSSTSRNGGQNSQASQYFELLEMEREPPRAALEACLAAVAFSDNRLLECVRSLLGECDSEVVAETARRNGKTWFAATPQQGSAL